jgi:zinc resistance-associated protein
MLLNAKYDFETTLPRTSTSRNGSEAIAMIKTILAGTVAMLIAGSTLAHAQQRPDGARRWMPSVEDMRAFGDARIAGLKAGLVLNAEQEKNWPAFEQAARDFQKLRVDRLSAGIEARRSGQPRTTNPAELLERRAGAMAETGTALKKLADATGPLYASLDDSQKRRFGILSRIGAAAQPGHPMMHDRFGPRFRRTDDGGVENGPAGPNGPMRGLVRPIRGEEDL